MRKETEENGGKRKKDAMGNTQFGKMTLGGKKFLSKMHPDDLLILNEKETRSYFVFFLTHSTTHDGLCVVLCEKLTI